MRRPLLYLLINRKVLPSARFSTLHVVGMIRCKHPICREIVSTFWTDDALDAIEWIFRCTKAGYHVYVSTCSLQYVHVCLDLKGHVNLHVVFWCINFVFVGEFLHRLFNAVPNTEGSTWFRLNQRVSIYIKS